MKWSSASRDSARHASAYVPTAKVSLQGKTAVITGASTGIGRASALRFAQEGARLVLADVQDAEGEALALDYATRGIRVNALCPGIIDTPMLRRFADAMPDPAAAWTEYRTAQPMRRLGTPEECAAAALWLVSPEAGFVTGVALPVDGGFTAM